MLSAGEYEVLKDMRVKSVSTGAETPFVKATGGWVCVCVCLCVLCERAVWCIRDRQREKRLTERAREKRE